MPDIRTKEEYEQYKQDVAAFILNERIEFLSTGCEPDAGSSGEPWFSWRACECCKSPLGGMREYLFACLKGTDEQVRYQICEDCVNYIEYGRLDDETMSRIGL